MVEPVLQPVCVRGECRLRSASVREHPVGPGSEGEMRDRRRQVLPARHQGKRCGKRGKLLAGAGCIQLILLTGQTKFCSCAQSYLRRVAIIIITIIIIIIIIILVPYFQAKARKPTGM